MLATLRAAAGRIFANRTVRFAIGAAAAAFGTELLSYVHTEQREEMSELEDQLKAAHAELEALQVRLDERMRLTARYPAAEDLDPLQFQNPETFTRLTGVPVAMPEDVPAEPDPAA